MKTADVAANQDKLWEIRVCEKHMFTHVYTCVRWGDRWERGKGNQLNPILPEGSITHSD